VELKLWTLPRRDTLLPKSAAILFPAANLSLQPGSLTTSLSLFAKIDVQEPEGVRPCFPIMLPDAATMPPPLANDAFPALLPSIPVTLEQTVLILPAGAALLAAAPRLRYAPSKGRSLPTTR